jgi:hypothetical protein
MLPVHNRYSVAARRGHKFLAQSCALLQLDALNFSESSEDTASRFSEELFNFECVFETPRCEEAAPAHLCGGAASSGARLMLRVR